jgi:signal transduction histidine kinase
MNQLKWVIPTISDLLVRENINRDLRLIEFDQTSTPTPSSPKGKNVDWQLKAEKEWYSAIASVQQLLNQSYQLFPPSKPGLVLAGPSAVFNYPQLTNNLITGIFTNEAGISLAEISNTNKPIALLPAHHQEKYCCADLLSELPTFPLFQEDPLNQEPFCLVLTDHLNLVMVLGKDGTGQPAFFFSFDPEIVHKSWLLLQQRLLLLKKHTESLSDKQLTNITLTQVGARLGSLEKLVNQFPPVTPDYQTVMQFTQLLLQNLPADVIKTETSKNDHEAPKSDVMSNLTAKLEYLKSLEVELLQAIAHEVKTPLATIRTLTRLLLKRPQLDIEVLKKRLQMIDSECTTQIDRFGLIFRAVELETKQRKANSHNPVNHHNEMQLTPIPLAQVFETSVPKWEQKAQQRDHSLQVNLPAQMPTIVSDPVMLEQVLSSLIENFSRNLPGGSQIQVGVTLAGHQLKLQLESAGLEEQKENYPAHHLQNTAKSIGPLLTFQPETGSLSLNLKVTKNLFQAMGGKLVVRQRPQKGEVMTIFLPLD